jgi:uncharacterized protein (TIGR04255 family)
MESNISEVIFEIRWGNQNPILKGEIKSSPEYNILLGMFLETFRKDFRAFETLPSAGMPEGISRGLIQYRLRRNASENWPLVQLGPGVFSLNINKDSWSEFKSLITKYADKFDQISKDFNLETIKIKLTYILAKEFDFEKEDLNEFLKNKLNIEVSMGSSRKLDKMKTINFQTKITIDNPTGDLIYLVAEGKKKELKAIVWQAQLESEIPQILKGKELLQWLDAANLVVRKWARI